MNLVPARLCDLWKMSAGTLPVGEGSVAKSERAAMSDAGSSEGCQEAVVRVISSPKVCVVRVDVLWQWPSEALIYVTWAGEWE